MGLSEQLSKYHLHKRTQRTLEQAYRLVIGPYLIINALPSLGKSYSAVRAVVVTGEQITILTGRGRKEQYSQYSDWCENARLDYRVLPSFVHDCPARAGDYSDTWQRRMRELHGKGIPVQFIHEVATDYFGADPPCRSPECPYVEAWQFDPTEVDVLIGHYTHAHVPKAIKERTVVLDEFPGDAYESEITNPGQMVTQFLRERDLPYDSYTDLIESRNVSRKQDLAREWFGSNGLQLTTEDILDGEALTALTPNVVYTLIFARDLGNGWAQVGLPGRDSRKLSNGHIGVEHRADGTVHLLRPPDLAIAKNVLALDGTPTPIMWEIATNHHLKPHQVLTDQERREYVRDVLNLEIIRTTEAVKPYHGKFINVKQDGALLEGIHLREGRLTDLITTKTALKDHYPEHGLTDLVNDSKHYGDLLGSNAFKSSSVGCVIGSEHYGDGFIEKWGAYAGRGIERNEEKGTELSYGDYGDAIARYMREFQTLQAVLRFGRDGTGATVYVNTNTLPEWVPLAGLGTVYVFEKNAGLRQVVDAGIELEEWRTSMMANHPDVEIGSRMVRKWLKRLFEWGYVGCSMVGRGYEWHDTGLDQLGTYGVLDVKND